MKKFNKYALLVLIQSVIILCSCKIVSKNQKLFITASGSIEHPVKITVGNFLSFGVILDLIDTSNFNKSYHFVPGEMLSINKDTSIRLFYADSLIVDYQNEKLIFRSANLENTKYNRFYNDLSSLLIPIYESDLIFFIDKDDNIIQDEQYINNHLSKSDSFITQQINILFSKYQFIQSTRFELMSSVLESQKLARSYFYLSNRIPQLDSLGILQVRLQYYIDKINQQHVSVFSQNDISLLIQTIAYRLIWKSINRIKSKGELKNY